MKYNRLNDKDEVTINTLIVISILTVLAFIGWIAVVNQ